MKGRLASRATFFDSELTDGRMIQYTTVTNNQ